MNTYVNNIIIEIYVNILIASIAIIAKGTNWIVEVTDYYQNRKFNLSFEECVVDLIGPWIIQVRGNPYEFSALTAIDTVTNLVELVRIDDKTSDNVARKYAQCWLARYPWPQRCIHDPGEEFTGIEFQKLLEKCHIKDACTSEKKTQSNAICERMHQTVGNVLSTLLHG